MQNVPSTVSVVEVEGAVKLSDVGKVRDPSADESPPEQLECRLVVVEKHSSVVIIHVIDVDCAKCKADVDNDKDEEEYQNINNHVGHGDDDWASLTPH